MSELLIGRRLGNRYRVDEHLGSGGMGAVYRGWDEDLNKPVALKIADSTFRSEARKLAKINHPNVAAIYGFGNDDGIDFLIMEYVSGVTLDERVSAGPMAESDVVNLALQLSEGMKAAHERGIVHSDLKPANVRVTDTGLLKILDFGIARHVTGASEETSTVDPGTIQGTAAYMAPEQMRSAEADVRSDIYSAGTLLFELATGRRPFTDRSISILIHKVQNEAPPRPRSLNRAISPALESILLKCLEKDPQDRFSSAQDLATALQSIGAESQGGTDPGRRDSFSTRFRRISKSRAARVAGAGLVAGAVAVSGWFVYRHFTSGPVERPRAITRLAVLPFRNISSNTANEYLSDGISDELSTRIGQIDYNRLRVVGFPATIRYKSQAVDVAEIRKTLGVDYILDGSVTSDASNLIINARLSDTETGTQRWARRYRGRLSEAIAVQENIADSIGAALYLALGSHASAAPRPTAPSDAGYDHYLRGQSYQRQRTDQALREALSEFTAATASDPNQAAFHAELARTQVLIENYGFESAEVTMPRALESARTALSLDTNLAIGHVAMAAVRQDYERNWKAAETEYRRAIALDPSSPAARQGFASLLLITGRKDSALEQLRAALDLDPLSLAIHLDLGAYHYLAGDYTQALESFERACQLYPDAAIAQYQKGVTLVMLNRTDEAVEAIAKAMRGDGATEAEIGTMRSAFQSDGIKGYWNWKLTRLVREAQSGFVPAYPLARAYAAVGNLDRAFSLLNLSADRRESALAGIVVDPVFRSLAGDPRFAVLLQRLHLSIS